MRSTAAEPLEPRAGPGSQRALVDGAAGAGPVRWILGQGEAAEAEQAASLARAIGIHPVAARVLCRRGLARPEQVEAFLADDLAGLPDPFLLRDMDRAVERIAAAIARGEKIVAYGDYDVDGVSSTVQLVTLLRAAGAQIDWFVPHRLREGYGLNPEAIERLAAGGAKLIVSLDCGVGAVEEVDRAAALGVDVIVVDHHQLSPELPRAAAILNPLQPDCRFPEKRLCAAGVTFFLVMALRKRLREAGAFAGREEPNLRRMLDLVALGTVADVVPLLGANRTLVRAGLVEIARGARPGLRALAEVAGLPPSRAVTAGQVGFKLGPRINAAGRMDDAGRAVRLLLAETPEEAVRLARALDEENRSRREIEAAILREALAQAGERLARDPPRGLVLAAEGWHPGVVGIVASRVAERTGRPAILLAIEGEQAKGSGRSVAGFDIHGAIAQCGGLLDRFGGHRAAIGLALPARSIPEFRAAFEAASARGLSDEQVGPRCHVELPVAAGDLTERLALDLEKLAPFGAGNPEPVLAAFGLSGKARAMPAREEGSEPHLEVRFPGRTPPAIGFGMGREAGLCDGPVDAAFHLEVDRWQGRSRLRLRLRALRAAQAS